MNRSAPTSPAEGPDEGTVPLPRPLKQKIKDGLVALSLGNLCFTTAWFNALYDKDSYFNKLPVMAPTLLALLANIFWVSALIWLVIRLARRFRNRALHLVFDLWLAGLLLIPANFVRYDIFRIWDYQVLEFFKQPVVMLCAVVVAALAVWKHAWTGGLARVVAACLSPLAFFTLGKTALLLFGVIHLDQQVTEPVLPPPVAVPAGQPRVVWIIFDASDYRMIYEQRPAGVELPEYDRLRAQSVCALNAISPANTTASSMPSLISGRQVVKTEPRGLSDLGITMADTGKTVSWKELPSVFGQARAMGVNTALVGWFHPYARVLQDSLNYCAWYPFPAFEPDREATFMGSLRRQIGCIAFTPHVRHIFLSVCQDSLRESVQLATNRTYGLMLFHLPPPHTPGVYLPKEHRFTFWPMTRVGGYLNNLGLADMELGRIRRAMEAAGEWDKTWVIVSADHSWQQANLYDGKIDYRVPFVIKPPGENDGVAYSPKLNTLITHDLILDILRGKVTSPDSLVAWLDKHSQALPVAIQPGEN